MANDDRTDKEAGRKGKRGYFDLDEALKAKIRELSIEWGCPQSQVAMLLLYVSLEELSSGKVDLSGLFEPSDSPAYQTRINVDKLRERYKKRW